MRSLLKDDGSYDRAAIMRDAYRQQRQSRAFAIGWSWSHCLRFSWEKARRQREKRLEYLACAIAFRNAPRAQRARPELRVF